jgi:hypothetical protein
MPNSKPCRFDTGEIDYEGSSRNNIIKTGSGSGSSTGSTTGSSSKKPKLSYKEMGKPKPKPAPFPWVMVIGITMGVLFIISGIYYYYNFGPGAPIIPVKKIVKKVVKGGLLTSKFIKKSGGYSLPIESLLDSTESPNEENFYDLVFSCYSCFFLHISGFIFCTLT